MTDPQTPAAAAEGGGESPLTVDCYDAAFWCASYRLLSEAIERNFADFVQDGDEAEEAIYVAALDRVAAALRAQSDSQEVDGTDAAHPAWWRGNDAGVETVVAQLTRQLDLGKVGTFGSPKLEALSQRLEQLRAPSGNTPELVSLEARLIQYERDVEDVVRKTVQRSKGFAVRMDSKADELDRLRNAFLLASSPSPRTPAIAALPSPETGTGPTMAHFEEMVESYGAAMFDVSSYSTRIAVARKNDLLAAIQQLHSRASEGK